MSQLHVARIKNKLDKLFGNFITKDGEGNHFYSKSLASFFLYHSSGLKCEEAVNCLTDGFDDCGIDAIYINDNSRTLILVQSKFIKKGSGSPGKDCVLKFLEGFELLLQGEFDKFNDQIRSKEAELTKVLFNDDYKIELVIVHSGNGNLSQSCIHRLDAVKEELNDTDETLTYKEMNLPILYQLVMSSVDGDPINLENVSIYDWGKHTDPHKSYYGEIEATKIAEWWKSYGIRLLIKNIRQYKRNSVINKYIQQTLITKPDDFWYFNNGITVLCQKIGRTPSRGTRRDTGVFHLYGAHIVNGAQTFGCIGNAFLRFPEKVADARVFLKVIELKNADDRYYKEITRYTNTQNKIGDKDFAALDPQQERLRMELKMDGINYIYKAGDQLKDAKSGFTLEEATTALA